MDLNKVLLVGRVTADPQVRTTPGGQSVTTIGVATNRVCTDKNNQRQEETEFHNVVLWGRQAEIVNQFLKKGSLVIVGDGPLKNKLKLLGAKLLKKRFFLTKAKFDQMPRIYRAADLFTLPSPWFRAFEIVLVESMACGIPVVANDDPIRAEIVGEAGILVDPTNTEEYAAVLKKALEKDWGSKPRNQAKKFDWDKIAAKYEKLFVDLVLR